MSNKAVRSRFPLRRKLLNKIMGYGGKAARLGRRVRELVFGFRLRSTAHTDRWALPIKLLHDHRVLNRQRAFKKGGGADSSVAKHALEKVRRVQK